MLVILFGCVNEISESSLTEGKQELTEDYIYRLSDSVIKNKDLFSNVWNFNEFDSGTIEFHRVNLLNSVENEKVVSIKGFTGCSAGCSGHLLFIFDSNNLLLNVSQRPISMEFIDINSDGKSELYLNNFIMWMGECREYHLLTDAENDSVYFYWSKNSPETCGYVQGDPYVGDTLLNAAEVSFKDVDNDNIMEVIVQSKIRLVSDTTLRLFTDTIYLREVNK